jgi:hypothetical protein
LTSLEKRPASKPADVEFEALTRLIALARMTGNRPSAAKLQEFAPQAGR